MTLTKRDFRELARLLDAVFDDRHAALYRPRYNIAPTDAHWIVREKQERRELLPAAWGLAPARANGGTPDARYINARSETAASSPAFRDAFQRTRCIVPADGFFEWIGARESRRPVWFHPPDDGLLLFAGLYASAPLPDGRRARSFAILTTAANEAVAPVHDRMPVILSPDGAAHWLHAPARAAASHAAAPGDVLRPCPPEWLVATEVSRRANSVANDDPGCIAPALDRETFEAPRLL